MALDSVVVYCGGCQARLEEDDPHAPAEQRCPCPHCGSLLRHFEANMSGTLTFHSKLAGKGAILVKSDLSSNKQSATTSIVRPGAGCNFTGS